MTGDPSRPADALLVGTPNRPSGWVARRETGRRKHPDHPNFGYDPCRVKRSARANDAACEVFAARRPAGASRSTSAAAGTKAAIAARRFGELLGLDRLRRGDFDHHQLGYPVPGLD